MRHVRALGAFVVLGALTTTVACTAHERPKPTQRVVTPALVTAVPAATTTPAPLPVPDPCSGHGKSIRVSIGQQRAWLCDGSRLTLSTPVTTGADVPGRRTRTGTWHIHGAQTHRWLGGPGYSVRVHWWLPYSGDFGFHDAPWQKMSFGSAGWRTHGSHGCVHLPHDAMRALYRWAPVGTTVTIRR